MCWKLAEQLGPENSDQPLGGQVQKSHMVQSCWTPSLITWTSLPWLWRLADTPKGHVTLWQGRVQVGKMQSWICTGMTPCNHTLRPTTSKAALEFWVKDECEPAVCPWGEEGAWVTLGRVFPGQGRILPLHSAVVESPSGALDTAPESSSWEVLFINWGGRGYGGQYKINQKITLLNLFKQKFFRKQVYIQHQVIVLLQFTSNLTGEGINKSIVIFHSKWHKTENSNLSH